MFALQGKCKASAIFLYVAVHLQIQLAVLQSLTAHVAQFRDTAMEFLLQKVLMVLTYLHRRAPGSVPHQLQSLAIACFTALRAADTCEVSVSFFLDIDCIVQGLLTAF